MCQRTHQNITSKELNSQSVKSSPTLIPLFLRKKRSSSVDNFNFKQDCLFCGEKCILLEPGCRNPERWRRIRQCRTAQNFKQNILDVCDLRNDVLAEDVRTRVHGAVADLHAADAQYHDDCYKDFVSTRSINAAYRKSTSSQPMDEDVDAAFMSVTADLKADTTRMWNSVELQYTT